MAQEYFRKINYYETDKMGITHHSNYIRFTKTEKVVFVGKSRHCFVNTDGKLVALSKKYPAYDAILKAQVNPA